MSQPNILKCACAQLNHTPYHSDGLLQQHLDAIGEARAQGVDLLVFPETSLTGYPPDAAEGRKLAIWADDPQLFELAKACKEIMAVVGFIEEARGGHFYNSIAWLQNGQILQVYRKINLPTYGHLDEGKFFTAGISTATQEIDRHWQCGGMICADAWDPGLLYLSALHNTTVLAMPVASTQEVIGGGLPNKDGWPLVTRYAAMMYGLPILRCNWVGSHVDKQFWGGSAIHDAFGQTLVEASDTAEIIYADLTYEDVVTARQASPTTRTLSPEVLLSELPSLIK
jgi:predicted amidohydrolase